MPGINQQIVEDDRLFVGFTDNTSIQITKEQILSHYQNSVAADREADTITWVKSQVAVAAGTDYVTLTEYQFDFNRETGSPTLFGRVPPEE